MQVYDESAVLMGELEMIEPVRRRDSVPVLWTRPGADRFEIIYLEMMHIK